MNYRITKFDPLKRNTDGSYADPAEWTSISDIGKPKYGNPTFEEYQLIENGYVQALRQILTANSVTEMEIRDLELHSTKSDFDDYKKSGRLKNLIIDFDSEVSQLKNGDKITLERLELLTRLILRETIWMNMTSERVKVNFGYDFYMSVECPPIPSEVVEKIAESGLFLEE